MLFQAIPQVLILVSSPYFKIQILPVKSGHHHLRILQIQHAENIVPHLRRRCRGKCTDHRPHRQLLHKVNDIQIARAEILSPLRNAVRLIHRHHTDAGSVRKIKKQRCQQPLWRNIDDLIAARTGVFHRTADLIFA